jgi:parvulin-like peptidyl-prolyl isomerase
MSLVTLCALCTTVLCVPSPDENAAVAARVNGTAILESDVSLELRKGNVRKEEHAKFRDRLLQKLIERELILQWLEERKQAASPSEIELELERLRRRLASREVSLAQFLAERDLRERDLLNAFRWQISWQRFLDRYLSESNLQRYFDKHRRDFDGTTMRVAHILLKLPEQADPEERRARLAEAEVIRRRINTGELTFSEAARVYSKAPSAEEAGELGMIARYEPMPESFSAAAFALEEGQLSAPVSSPFGVHLIRCHEILPGQRTWEDADDELRRAITSYLFRWAAVQARANATIERADGPASP